MILDSLIWKYYCLDKSLVKSSFYSRNSYTIFQAWCILSPWINSTTKINSYLRVSKSEIYKLRLRANREFHTFYWSRKAKKGNRKEFIKEIIKTMRAVSSAPNIWYMQIKVYLIASLQDGLLLSKCRQWNVFRAVLRICLTVVQYHTIHDCLQ